MSLPTHFCLRLLLLLGLTLSLIHASSASSQILVPPPDGPHYYYSVDSSYCLVYTLSTDRATRLRSCTSAFYRCETREPKYLHWERPPMSCDLPHEVLISRTGRYVVEIDRGSGSGYGNNVVMIFGLQGQQIRSLGQVDFCPDGSATADSARRMWIWDAWNENYWGSGHYLDENKAQLVLRMIPNCRRFSRPEDKHIEVRIDLETGTVLTDLGRSRLSWATGPDTLWSRHYTLGHESWNTRVIPSSYGGFVVALFQENYVPPTPRLELCRISATGDSLWCRLLDTLRASCGDAVELEDGGFAVAAQFRHCHRMENGKYDCQNSIEVIRTDDQGNVLWIRQFQGNWWGNLALAELPGSNLLIASGIRSEQGGGCGIFCLDTAGQTLWSRELPEQWIRAPSSLIVTPSDEIWLFFTERSANQANVVVLDFNGETRRTLDSGAAFQTGYSATSDGFMVKHLRRPHQIVARWNTQLKPSWEHDLGNMDSVHVIGIHGNDKQGWWISGVQSRIQGRSQDYLVTHFDPNGHCLWTWTAGDGEAEVAHAAIPTLDGGTLVAGIRGRNLYLFQLAAP